MKNRILFLVGTILLFSAAITTITQAGGLTPLTTTWLDPIGAGVSHDSTGDTYNHGGVYFGGARAVQSYFSPNGRNVVLVTYSTGRTLHFVFDGNERNVWGDGAGLTQNVDAEIDLFGINQFGQYEKMDINATARVQMDLEFHFPPTGNPETYELAYSNLAAKRETAYVWLITSDPFDICEGGSPNCAGFTPSDEAKLNTVRRRKSTEFGTVHMPIRFRVEIQH